MEGCGGALCPCHTPQETTLFALGFTVGGRRASVIRPAIGTAGQVDQRIRAVLATERVHARCAARFVMAEVSAVCAASIGPGRRAVVLIVGVRCRIQT